MLFSLLIKNKNRVNFGPLACTWAQTTDWKYSVFKFKNIDLSFKKVSKESKITPVVL